MLEGKFVEFHFFLLSIQSYQMYKVTQYHHMSHQIRIGTLHNQKQVVIIEVKILFWNKARLGSLVSTPGFYMTSSAQKIVV